MISPAAIGTNFSPRQNEHSTSCSKQEYNLTYQPGTFSWESSIMIQPLLVLLDVQ